MRIVLHAGLHKSGSTSVQGAWHAAFGEPGAVWYPSRPAGRLPGHHAAIWPLLDAYNAVEPADLVWAHSQRGTGGETLRDYVRRAEESEVEVLLISTEELDRLQASDVPRFREILAGHEVTFVLTVTRPLHRWASGWQTMVKHGLAQYPRDAATHITSYGSLGMDRVAELSQLLGAERSLVRVVRTSPPEEDLPRQLLEAAGVIWPEGVEVPPIRNVSVGTDVEVLRRMNELDLTLGTMEKGDRKHLRRLVASAEGERHVPGLAERYAPPPEFWAAARAEQEFLAEGAASLGVEVIDPHGQLSTWTDDTPSEWYQRISERELDVPELGDPVEAEELLWRVRQERSALRARAVRNDQELRKLRRASARQKAKIAELREQVAAQQQPGVRTRVKRLLGR